MAGPLAPGPLMDREQSREQSGPLMDREQSREQSGASLASHQAGATVCHSPLARSVGRGGRVRARVSQWVGGSVGGAHAPTYICMHQAGGSVGQRWGKGGAHLLGSTCCCTRWIPILTHVRTVHAAVLAGSPYSLTYVRSPFGQTSRSVRTSAMSACSHTYIPACMHPHAYAHICMHTFGQTSRSVGTSACSIRRRSCESGTVSWLHWPAFGPLAAMR